MPAPFVCCSQTAARYDLPYVVDVGVADSIVTRGLKNTFRFGQASASSPNSHRQSGDINAKLAIRPKQ